MRIAYILPDWPEPPRRGYQRIAVERIRRLASSCDVEVFYFTLRNSAGMVNHGISERCGAVHPVVRTRLRSLWGAIVGFFRGDPLQVGFYQSRRMQSAIDEAHRRKKFDMVIVQLVRLARFLPTDYDGNTVLDMVDPLSMSYMRSLEWRKWYARWLFRLEAYRLLSYERRVAKRFKTVLLVSNDELNAYRNLLGTGRVEVVPYGVDTDYFTPPIVPRVPGMIVLSGNLGYAPNVQAVHYFCTEVFPMIQRESASATLWLVGANPSPDVRKWHDNKRIFVTGEVVDIREYIKKAVVAVCPVRHRVGTQTKILEALASGTPVVATDAAVSGLPLQDMPVKVGSDPAEFAAHVIELLDGLNWKGCSEESRRYVVQHFSWDASISIFKTTVDCR